jgi:uncharacterized protein
MSTWSMPPVFLLCLSLGACGSSPEPVYYAMTAVTAARVPPPTPTWAHLIKVRRPQLAGYLDRAEVVSGISRFRLRIAGGDSWSEPLGDMTGRILAEDLAERLAGSVVFTETSPITSSPDAVVSLDIQRFDEGDDGALTLRGSVSVERSEGRGVVAVRIVALHARPSDSNTAALVAAMSDIVGRLADQLVPLLETDASVTQPRGDAPQR